MKWTLLILFAASFLFPLSGYSQTAGEIDQILKHTDVEGLKKFRAETNARYIQRQKLLKEFARRYEWPAKIGVNGRAKILFDISPDRKPIYIEPLDSDATITVKSNELYTGGGLALSLHGEGMTAAVFDVGPIMTSHTAFENRATIKDGIFYTSGSSSHPTRVAGQIIASSAYHNDTTYNGTTWGKAMGIAFKANVHGYTTLNHITKANSAAGAGLLASNHSYGTNATNGTIPASFYGPDTRDFDNIMQLAPYYLSIWACGNNNNATAYDRLSDFATTKNGLSVANVLDIANYTGPGDVQRTSSSRGPSDDYRIKPDIAAPGSKQRVLEADATNSNTYAVDAGTSFSAPIVTGAILLFQQHYKNLNGHFMRAATAKGVALHTTFEAGPNPGPDISYGWGLLNTERAVNAITNNGGTALITEETLQNGNSFSRELVASGNEPLMVTISWTDIKGTAVSDNDRTPQLVNDLDSRLQANASTFYPWKLDTANVDGPALRGDNRRDNIERVEISNPVAGQVYTLTVNHKGSLSGGSQNFSVIVTGLEECVATRTISASVNAASTDHQQASSAIIAQNVINKKGEAIYHAGDEVVFNNGFSAADSTLFTAYIEGCTNEYQLRKGAVERYVVTYNSVAPTKPVAEIELSENAVYPNPGNGIFKIKLNAATSGKVQILASDGTAIFNQTFMAQSELEADIKTAAPGVYVLRVFSEDKVLTKKIIKK
jgi:serine protease AprX